MDYKDLLNTALRAAGEASRAILDVYRSDDFQTEQKADDSPVTIADKKAHAIIASYLEPTGLPVLSEEGRTIPFEERRQWDYFWLVDPLDGTKEFLKRNGDFTVNIALVSQGIPRLGVVSVPVTGETYYAAPGWGAYKRKDGSDIVLHKRVKADLLSPGLRVMASRTHMDPGTRSFISGLEAPVLTSRGSSLKFLLLAEGLADVYPRFSPTMEWDTAAAHAILKGVDLPVYEVGKDTELLYNKENLQNPGFLAG